MEAAMRMKASEVGGWLRQIAGKRDHREVPSNLAGSAMTGPP